MKPFRKKLYATAGYNTTFFGPGREEFNPKKPMATFDSYLKEAAEGSLSQLTDKEADIDEGVICNFMAPRFIKQGNLPGFLPSVVPSLCGKPCTGTEGACGSGGRGLAIASRALLSDQADSVFVTGFEIQHTMKAVYGADVLSAAGAYNKERKKGYAHFFPGIFAERAGAYFNKFDADLTRRAMAKWYEHSILCARKNPKAQEFHNTAKSPFDLAMSKPNPEQFVPNLNYYDCSKVSDGASALFMLSEDGLSKHGIDKSKAIEIVAIGAAEGDITKDPSDQTVLANTAIAVKKALEQAQIKKEDLSVIEIHDCFSITALLALEAIGFADHGKAAEFVLDNKMGMDGEIPTNLSGGLCGFGHPVGASGVRQLVDLLHQFTNSAENPLEKMRTPYGMMISMGGNDITVTAIIVKQC